MTARRRVLLIAPCADGNDVSEAWNAFQWARLLSHRHDVTVLSSYKRGHVPLSQQLPDVRVVEWPEPALWSRFERLNSLLQPGYVRFYRRARRWLRTALAAGDEYDVALQVVPVAMRYPSPVAGTGIPFYVGPVGGSLASPPAFVGEEGGTPWYQRLRAVDGLRLRRDPMLRSTYTSADAVIGIAPYVRTLLADVPVRRFEIMSEVALHDVREPIDRSGRTGPVRLLHVGRTIRTKGLRDLIRAMAQLRDLPVHLDVLGDGNDRAACEQLIRELELDDRVTLHGMVPREVVDEFYARADVFVFPSYREPGGGVIMEAMAAGLPLVLCDRGGPAAFVSDECAVLVPAHSPAQLAADCAAAIRGLVEDPERRTRMGRAAREHAARTHLWSHRVAQMESMWG